jgi:hypothetical protein
MISYAFENPQAPRRLLRHCVLFGQALGWRVSARHRLEAEIGREETRRLLDALTGISVSSAEPAAESDPRRGAARA